MNHLGDSIRSVLGRDDRVTRKRLPIRSAATGTASFANQLDCQCFLRFGQVISRNQLLACGLQRCDPMVQATLSDQAINTKVDSLAAAIRVTLVGGILGFESHRDWLLIANPDELPFQWLRAHDNPRLAFLVLPPSLAKPDYKPDVSAGDVAFLELNDSEDALVLNVVTLRDHQPATINLKGPILLNRRTLIGKQIVPVNAADYSVQHPLPVVA